MASGNTLLVFAALGAEFPNTGYASLSMSNDHPVLEYSEGLNAISLFRGVIPRNYSGGGITVVVYWKANTATTGAVVWAGEFENLLGFNIAAGTSFGTLVTSTATTTNATAGFVNTTTFAFTNAQIDGLGAGDPFRFRLVRVDNNAADTLTGGAHFLQLEMRET